jgi:CelD/BcsL family acetyltransferase involved in cellulose biosynthesis
MDFQRISPLDYPEWDDLLLESSDSSFFHTSAWAKVIVESYGYKPIYFVSRDNDRLTCLMPFMEIASRLTGRRGVSLPFTDFCDPFGPAESRQEAVQAALEHGRRSKWRFAEWRTSEDLTEGVPSSKPYLTHELDLTRSETDILSGLSKSHRRNLKRAMKNEMDLTFDRTRVTLEDFYRLHCQTRRRHGLPPQPLLFFKKILEHILSRDLGIIVSARRSGQVIASSVFFHFGSKAIFKYGASDPKALGYKPNNLVIWEAIRWYRDHGASGLNLGRTAIEAEGLRHFKVSWGASESALRYYRYDFDRVDFARSPLRGDYPLRLLSKAPLALLRLAGRLFYKHFG